MRKKRNLFGEMMISIEDMNSHRQGKLALRTFQHVILRLALFEAVGLFGFMIAMDYHDATKSFPFLALASFGFYRTFPSKNLFERI